jgi:hypothetical protein
MIEYDATQKRDLRFLNKRAPAKGTPIPPAASLTMPQLYEIERMANEGLNLAQIGRRLHFKEDVWEQVILHNPSVKEAYIEGMTRLQEQGCKALTDGVKRGEVALLRLAADRGMLGPQWEPKNKPLVVETRGPMVAVDVVASVETAFERQRQLLLESEAEED